MSAYVLWLDTQEAKLFKLVPQEAQKQHLKMHGHKHFKHPHGKHEGHHHPDAERFYAEVAQSVKDASELLIMGPGEAKTQFKHHLDKHFKSTIAEKVVGIETVDHPTDNQILERARKFFKNYDLFV